MHHKTAKLLLALGILTGAVLGSGLASPSSASALGGLTCSNRCGNPDCTCVIPCHSVGGGCVCSENACLPPP